MTVTVNLYSALSEHTDGRTQVQVSGSTIGECLNDLVGQFPKLRKVLFNKAGELFRHVFVSVNMKSVRPENLDVPLKEGDELHITLIIVGG